MNLLIDRLPNAVTIMGKEYEIETDFRVSVLFELMMQDDDLSPTEKCLQSLQLYFPQVHFWRSEEQIVEAIKSIIWFYKCGRSDKERERKKRDDDDEEGEKPERYYSFDYDDEYIYAAFLQQYGINLTTARLHWWEFRALFKGLSHDCEFCKIMGYRATKITGEMSKGEKDFYHKMKKLHALPLSEKEQEYQDALEDALMNGGDVSAVLRGTYNEK